MNKHKIYFYGALAKEGQLPHGGGQVGNAKTIKLYKRLGIDLVVIPKYFSPENKWLLPFVVLANCFDFFKELLWGNRSGNLVHVSGFYGAVIWHEWLLVLTSKMLGYQTIYEMRGGGAQGYYSDMGGAYRWAFKSTLRLANHVFTQGEENIPLIKKCCSTPIYYHPNYVEVEYLKYGREKNIGDVINLVYFGRLFEQKRIDLVVLTLKEIVDLDMKATLELIGAFESVEYENGIRKLIAAWGLSDIVTIVPKCNHKELAMRLADKHFFLFPSETPREGQSNALTEAMAFGVVPISADAGFSRSLIGVDELVFQVYTPIKAATKMLDIIDSKLWSGYSVFVSQRVCKQFSEDNQLRRLKEYLNQIL